MAEQAGPGFGGLLRRVRAEAGLTQEELAAAARLSPRSVSDLERGINRTARKDTARLLADALGLTGPARAEFEAAASGRPIPGGAAAATRTLPREVVSFTGRQRELGQLARAAAGSVGVVGIYAIGGMAGVGKTAFAVHAAHLLAGRYPGGQIFLPLHGHTPGQVPVDPADALASLLLTAGVAAAHIPPGLDARTALWRDRLAGRQLLLVLDDAVDSEQVRPLLPGSGGSLVLITSRRHLSALEGATAVALDTLPPGQAAALLVRLAGRPGLAPDDPAVGDITALCGYLPLAIGMVARQLHHHPAWTAAGRAAELAAAADRLELMATENVSVAAAFDLSYADLTGQQQRLFRRLGLHPGDSIDGYAAAALDGTGLHTACGGLEALYDQCLLTEPAAGRYRMHDLIRAHARALASRLDSDRDRDQATGRLLDYYQHTAGRANALITLQTRPAPACPDGAVPAAVPVLADREQALAWARAERGSLLACLDQATAASQHARVVALTAGLAGLLRNDGPWPEAVTRHTAAAQAAVYLGDRLGQANALNDLGHLLRLTSDYPAAVQVLEQALAIYRDLGDRLGQANALFDLGPIRWLTGDHQGGVQALEQALAIYRDLGDQLGQANALSYLGSGRRMIGDYPGAAQAHTEQLAICRDLGDRLGQADALRELGAVQWDTGDYPAAAQLVEQALAIFCDLGDKSGQGETLYYLGGIRRRTGDYLAATQVLDQSLNILRGLGDRRSEANALCHLAEVRLATGDYPAAAQLLGQALDFYRGSGERQSQAYVLCQLGVIQRETSQYPAAGQLLDQSLGILRDLGDRVGESEALNEKGTLHRATGDLAQAKGCHQQALEQARAIASPLTEAHALAGLGRCALAAGQTDEAADMLRKALRIYQRMGAVEAADVSAELQALANARPAGQGT